MPINAAALKRSRTRPSARAVSIPAPSGGLNTLVDRASMPPEDAYVMDNWFPGDGAVEIRKGFEEFADGVGTGNVDFLFELEAGTTSKFIAASNDTLYDITAGGRATSISAGFNTGQWDATQFSGKLFLVNDSDSDAPQDWDGSTLTATSWTGPSDINKLTGVYGFKNRLFFVEKDSQDFWYSDLDAVTGTLTKFPLSRVANFGGNLIAINSWSRSAPSAPASSLEVETGTTEGVDDVAVFIMSSGEIVVYEGSDPGTASKWALLGIFKVAKPIGRHCAFSVGGDLVIITENDYIFLSSVLGASTGRPTKVSGDIKDAFDETGNVFGWQGVIHGRSGKAIINIPKDDPEQHVLNLGNGAWCRYKDIPARHWAVFNGDLYFGSTNGRVYKAEVNHTDASPSLLLLDSGVKVGLNSGDDISLNQNNEDPIDATVRQAWNNFETPSRKRFTAIRAIVNSTAVSDYVVNLGLDFNDAVLTAPTTVVSTGTPWGSPWGSSWGTINFTDTDWRIAAGTAEYVSPSLRVSTKNRIRWRATDIRVQVGNAL